MPTEALVFDRSTTGRAERMAKEGMRGTYILRDRGAQGLSLRIENNTASWVLKYKDFTRTIGVLSPRPNSMELSGFTTARNLAADVRRVLKTNPSQAKEYIKLRHFGNNHDEAVAGLREEQTTWTLRECLEKTIEIRSNKSSQNAWSPNTKRDYEYVFGLQEWRKTLDQPCVEITSGDIERVRDALKKSGRTSTANKVIAYTRSVYNFCSRHFSGDSGLNKVVPWWKQLSSPYKIPPKQRTPAIEEIVKTLILAEQYLTKPLPGRKSSSPGTDARTLSGLWWIALTAQRANAGVSLRTHDIIQDESDKSWYLAAWSAEDMKARRSFILPVPKRAWDHINMFRSISTPRLASEWAFPSVRGTQKHVSASGVYRILYRLAGRDEKTVRKWRTSDNKARSGGRKSTKPAFCNLMDEAGIPWWSSHDIRRSLTECMNMKGIPGGSSAVLAHEINQSDFLQGNPSQRERLDFQAARAAEITRAAYGAECVYLPIKKLAMEHWTNTVLDEYERQKAR